MIQLHYYCSLRTSSQGLKLIPYYLLQLILISIFFYYKLVECLSTKVLFRFDLSFNLFSWQSLRLKAIKRFQYQDLLKPDINFFVVLLYLMKC